MSTAPSIDPSPYDRMHPEIRAIVEEAERSGGLPAAFDAKRAAFDALFEALGPGRADGVAVSDRTLGPLGVPTRLYLPEGTVPGVLVYTHGGGFEKGSLRSHDAFLSHLAAESGVAVLAVEYSLAPEHGYPTQLDEVAAVIATLDDVPELAGLPFAVGGDSVGGNLAAVTARRLRDAGGRLPVLQLLLYPVTDFTLGSESWSEFADGPWLSRDYERNALDVQYRKGRVEPTDPEVSPLRLGDASGLPAAFIADAELDGYRDEGQAYGRLLAAAGVPVDARVYPGMIHDFALMSGRAPAAGAVLVDAAAALRDAFADPASDRA